jgi:hypothetical protein
MELGLAGRAAIPGDVSGAGDRERVVARAVAINFGGGASAVV